MIKASELRPGNLILKFGELFKVTPWNLVEVKDAERSYAEVFTGIPFTGEWLLEAGFYNYLNKEYYLNTANGDEFRLFIKDDGFNLAYYKTKINHVHQLQNLYQALTGEELEFKALSTPHS